MQNKIIKKTEEYVKSRLSGEGSGHDWWHVYRVWQSAIHIGKHESVDMKVVELAALLHDIADWKFNDGDIEAGPKMAREWLEKNKVDEITISHVTEIVRNISFKGAGVKTTMQTKEGMVVQDADRLDATGAIGIGRCFAYGGYKGREMYNPKIKPEYHGSFEKYKKSNGTSINHFYEKMLLLKDLMNTKTGKKMAKERHKFMEKFLKEFYNEWAGKK